MTTLNVLITGASRGIGLATAKKLAVKGHHVGMFNTDSAKMAAALQDKVLNKAIDAGTILHGVMDVTQPQDWDDALKAMQDKFGAIDVLINNAGVLIAGKLPETNLEKQLALIDINCKGALIGCHKVAKYMEGNKNSKIINVSSAAAIYGQAEVATYSASKFFIRGLTEALDIEYSERGIKVIDIMPLWVETEMITDVSINSLKRLGVHLTADDVAETLCKLSTSSNRRLSKTHYPVGLLAKLLNSAVQIAPSRLVRWVNQRIIT